VQEKVTTISKDGEVTINLNLNITIDGESTIKVEANAATAPSPAQNNARDPAKKESPEKESWSTPEIVPEELFSPGDELLENFGN